MEMFFDLLQNFYRYSLTAKRTNWFWRSLYKIDKLRWKVIVHFSLKAKMKGLYFPDLIFQYAIFLDTILNLEYLSIDKIRDVNNTLTISIYRKDVGYIDDKEVMVKYIGLEYVDKNVQDNTQTSTSVEVQEEQNRYFCHMRYESKPIIFDGTKIYSKQLNYREIGKDDFLDSDAMMIRELEKEIRKKLFVDLRNTLYKAVDSI